MQALTAHKFSVRVNGACSIAQGSKGTYGHDNCTFLIPVEPSPVVRLATSNKHMTLYVRALPLPAAVTEVLVQHSDVFARWVLWFS